MTELRDPQKVRDAGKGEPVAIPRSSDLVRVAREAGHRPRTLKEVREHRASWPPVIA